MPYDDDQLALPFVVDQKDLDEFLARWLAIENEEDRLREEKRLLKETYADAFPMRPMMTAIKVVCARNKLAEHEKEPLSKEHQSILEHMIEAYIETEKDALA